jgi:hypothetical protein
MSPVNLSPSPTFPDIRVLPFRPRLPIHAAEITRRAACSVVARNRIRLRVTISMARAEDSRYDPLPGQGMIIECRTLGAVRAVLERVRADVAALDRMAVSDGAAMTTDGEVSHAL